LVSSGLDFEIVGTVDKYYFDGMPSVQLLSPLRKVGFFEIAWKVAKYYSGYMLSVQAFSRSTDCA